MPKTGKQATASTANDTNSNEIVRQIKICGNNKWLVFCKVPVVKTIKKDKASEETSASEDIPEENIIEENLIEETDTEKMIEAEEDGFFRLHKLIVPKASGLDSKVMKSEKDFSDYMAAQGEECEVWARLLPFDSSQPHNDEAYLVREDGTPIDAKWRAEFVWTVTPLSPSAREPKNKVPVFIVEHPGTRAVPVTFIKISEPVVGVIKFNIDGNDEVGYIRPSRMYLDGVRLQKALYKTAARMCDLLTQHQNEGKQIWALAVPYHNMNRDRERDPILIDGTPKKAKYYATKIWIGGDATPPNDEDEEEKQTAALINGSKAAGSSPQAPTLETIDIPRSEVVHENVSCKVVALSKFMVQLVVESGDEEIVGKKVVIPRLRVFIDGKPILKRKNDQELVSLDSIFTCNLAKKPSNMEGVNKETIWNESDFFGVMAWSGGDMPDVEKFDIWIKYRRRSHRCIIKAFLRDEEGRYVGGVAQLSKNEQARRSTASMASDRVRIWFDREDMVAFNASMANVDLAYFANLGDYVYVCFNGEKGKLSDLSYLTAHKVPAAKYKWFKAERACLDGPVLVNLFEPEKKFEFDSESAELKTFLEKHKIDIEDFQKHLDGQVEPKVKTDVNENEFALRADMPVQSGTMEVVRGPHTGPTRPFHRCNIYIFGRHMGVANLMDVIVHGDHFVVSVIDDIDGKVKIASGWKGPRPGEMTDELELYSKHSFKAWISRHKLANASMFHAFADGIAARRPFFPFTELPRANGYIRFMSSPLNPVNNKFTKQFGLIELSEGRHAKELVVFETDDLFVCGINVMNADLRKILRPGDRVTCEISPLTDAFKSIWRAKFETQRKKFKVPDVTSLEFKAQLVFIGARPKAPSKWHSELMPHDCEKNYKLREFLQKKGLTMEMFYKIVTSPKIYEKILAVDANPAMAPGFIQGEMLVHRAMLCSNVEDPNIASIVTNATEMETALFIAKTLETAVHIFSGQRGVGSGQSSASYLQKPSYGGHQQGQVTDAWGRPSAQQLPSLMSIKTAAAPRRPFGGAPPPPPPPEHLGYGSYGGYNLGQGGYSRPGSYGGQSISGGFGSDFSNKRRLSEGGFKNAKRNRGSPNFKKPWGRNDDDGPNF